MKDGGEDSYWSTSHKHHRYSQIRSDAHRTDSHVPAILFTVSHTDALKYTQRIFFSVTVIGPWANRDWTVSEPWSDPLQKSELTRSHAGTEQWLRPGAHWDVGGRREGRRSTGKHCVIQYERILRHRRTQGRETQYGKTLRDSVWAHIEIQADAGKGDAVRETLRDTVWAHIETQADARKGDAVRETLRDTVWAHIEK